MSTNEELREKEIELLRSVYLGEDAITLEEGLAITIKTYLSPPFQGTKIQIRVTLPPGYPSGNSVPTYGLTTGQLRGSYYVDNQLAILTKQSSRLHIYEMYDRTHHLTIFTKVQLLRAQCWLWLKAKVEQNEQVVVARDEERNAECWLARESGRQLKIPGMDAAIKEGEPVHDRGSSFVARAVRIVLVGGPETRRQLEEVKMTVEKILDTLRSISEIARAAHPCVYAWRCRIGNEIHIGGEDDGETRASVHIWRVLDSRNIENVLVVLTRYWNGVFLGPDRFDHVETATISALNMLED